MHKTSRSMASESCGGQHSTVGCLENRDELCRSNIRPRFRIIDRIDRHGISKGNILFLNQHSYFERVAFASIAKFDVKFDQGQQLQPAKLFKHPFVVELVGAGFDKPANARYFALRFPRVLKIHQDHTFKDTLASTSCRSWRGKPWKWYITSKYSAGLMP